MRLSLIPRKCYYNMNIVVHHSDFGALTHKDDEYCWAGVEDPKIVITTSHDPSSRLKQFSKVSSRECNRTLFLTA